MLGSLLLNWYFTPPLHTLNVADADHLVALALFLLVAVAVASVVDRSARRSVQADHARREADALSRLNRALLRTGHGVEELLGLVCEMFAMPSATLLRADPVAGWTVVATVAPGPRSTRPTPTPRPTRPRTCGCCCAAGRCRSRTAGC